MVAWSSAVAGVAGAVLPAFKAAAAVVAALLISPLAVARRFLRDPRPSRWAPAVVLAPAAEVEVLELQVRSLACLGLRRAEGVPGRATEPAVSAARVEAHSRSGLVEAPAAGLVE